MTKFRITLETAIRITKFSITPFGIWPLPADAKLSDVRRYNIWWCIMFLHVISFCTLVIYNIYLKLDQFNKVMVNATELVAFFASGEQMVICKLEATRLQGLIAEMNMFLKRATKEEMKTIQFYVDKCYPFHLMGYIIFLTGPLAFAAGPIVLPQPLPGDDEYPFSTEPIWIWMILYFSQCIALLQIGGMVIVNYMYAILIWYAVARFEINCLEFERAMTVDDLKRCISNHQQLIEYADRVRLTTRPMALHVIIVTILSISIGGFMLTRNPPLFDLVKYVIYYLGSVLQFFTIAWPADNLMDVSVKIGDSAYSSGWIGKPKMPKDIINIVQKTQFPIEISYDGLLPAMSLSLFRVGMTATFSYLATLRAIADG